MEFSEFNNLIKFFINTFEVILVDNNNTFSFDILFKENSFVTPCCFLSNNILYSLIKAKLNLQKIFLHVDHSYNFIKIRIKMNRFFLRDVLCISCKKISNLKNIIYEKKYEDNSEEQTMILRCLHCNSNKTLISQDLPITGFTNFTSEMIEFLHDLIIKKIKPKINYYFSHEMISEDNLNLFTKFCYCVTCKEEIIGIKFNQQNIITFNLTGGFIDPTEITKEKINLRLCPYCKTCNWLITCDEEYFKFRYTPNILSNLIMLRDKFLSQKIFIN